MTKRTCQICKRRKELKFFTKNKTVCDKCTSDPKPATAYRKRKYYKILSPLRLREFKLKYNNCCAGCEQPQSSIGNLDVKYSAFSGKPLGIFCHKCLTAIGLLEENRVTAKNLFRILRRHYPPIKN